MSAGTMTQQWTVWCCDCTDWEQVGGSKKSASNEFKKMGWVRVRSVWLCPACASLRNNPRTTE